MEVFGVGGPALQAEGLVPVVDARELLSMGFLEVLGRLPRILRSLGELEKVTRAKRPELAVVIDYPDFHFRLAATLQKLDVPVVYYIPPKVWVWRKKRIRKLRELFERVICIFPFEAEFFRGEGLDVRFVGNPLLDELPLELGREEARSRLGLKSADRTLLLMPGSRPSEVARHLDIMLSAAFRAARELRGRGELGESQCLQVLMPFPATASIEEIGKRVESWQAEHEEAREFLHIRVLAGDSALCMVASDAGLIKSGTSTLEAAVLGCPHAVVYRPTAVSSWIFKHLIRYRGPVGLVNLVAGGKPGAPLLVREILMENVTGETLATEAVRLLADDAVRSAQLSGMRAIREKLRGPEGGSPSVSAAEEVLSVLSQVRGRE